MYKPAAQFRVLSPIHNDEYSYGDTLFSIRDLFVVDRVPLVEARSIWYYGNDGA
jgi:hypothetical protein